MGIRWIGGGGGAGSGEVQGNGFVAHKDGLMIARQIVGNGVRIDNGDGVGGPVVVHAVPGRRRLGRLIGARGHVADEQPIAIVGARYYIPRSVVFVAARPGTPDVAMTAGIYTHPGKAGKTVVAATQTFEALSNDWAEITVPVNTGEQCAAPYLYWVVETLNATPITLNIYVYGDVLEQEFT